MKNFNVIINFAEIWKPVELQQPQKRHQQMEQSDSGRLDEAGSSQQPTVSFSHQNQSNEIDMNINRLYF